MNALLDTLPESTVGLEGVRENLMKSLASERIVGANILSSYLKAERLGLSEDIRKVIYLQVPKLSFKDLKNFHASEISKKDYVYCIVGNEKDLQDSSLSSLGDVKKLTLEDIFGY